MPTLNNFITGFVVGDNFSVTRTILSVNSGDGIVQAWFTIKINKEDDDADALLIKSITSFGTINGIITDDGSLDLSGAVRFDFVQDETNLFDPCILYWYEIKVKVSSTKIYTPEQGTIQAIGRVLLVIP